MGEVIVSLVGGIIFFYFSKPATCSVNFANFFNIFASFLSLSKASNKVFSSGEIGLRILKLFIKAELMI